MSDATRESDNSKASVSTIFAELETAMEAADELRLRTEAMAETPSLERGSGRFLVGMITAVYEVTDLAHPFFGPVFMGARGRLTASGCDLLLCANRPAHPGDPLRAAAVARTIRRGVDALIVWGIGNDDPELIPVIESGLPTVFVDHDPIGEKVANVMSDNIAAMAEWSITSIKAGTAGSLTSPGSRTRAPGSTAYSATAPSSHGSVSTTRTTTSSRATTTTTARERRPSACCDYPRCPTP